jgi:hypothetical protein
MDDPPNMDGCVVVAGCAGLAPNLDRELSLMVVLCNVKGYRDVVFVVVVVVVVGLNENIVRKLIFWAKAVCSG